MFPPARSRAAESTDSISAPAATPAKANHKKRISKRPAGQGIRKLRYEVERTIDRLISFLDNTEDTDADVASDDVPCDEDELEGAPRMDDDRPLRRQR